jgi:hypothetical protein
MLQHTYVHASSQAVWPVLLLLLLQAYKALAELCICALQQHSSSATQHLVNKSLERLLVQCGDEKGVAELGGRLSAAVLQQLQQAGLLQHLPALINAAALLPDAEQEPDSNSRSSKQVCWQRRKQQQQQQQQWPWHSQQHHNRRKRRCRTRNDG